MKQIPKYKEVSKKYSNMNVEVGEKTLLPTGLLVDHGGDKHSEGGTDVNLPEGAMIFSNAMKLDKSVVALLLNKDKSKVKRMTPAELAKKYATNELLENIESPDKYKANSAKLMLEKNITQLNSIFQAQEEHKKINGIESGKTLAEQGMKAEYGTAKYGGVAQVGSYNTIDNTISMLPKPLDYSYKPNNAISLDQMFKPFDYGVTSPILPEDMDMYEAYQTSQQVNADKWNTLNRPAKFTVLPTGEYVGVGRDQTSGSNVTFVPAMGMGFSQPNKKQIFNFPSQYVNDGVVKNEDIGKLFMEQSSFDPTTNSYDLSTPENIGKNQQLLQHLISNDNNHIPAFKAYGDHYTIIVTDKQGKNYRIEGSTEPTDPNMKSLPTISREQVLNNLTNYTAALPSPDGTNPNAFAHNYNYDDGINIFDTQTNYYEPGANIKEFSVGDPKTWANQTPAKSTNSTTPEVPKKPMTDYAIKSHNQIAADLYRKLFSAEMQAPYEIFNPGIAPVVRPAYQSTAPVQQALNNLSYTLDNSNASTQYGNALYADGLAKSLESSNQISRYNQQAAMEAEQKNTGNLVNTFNQNQQGFAANANANNINFLKAKDRYEHYKDDLFSRVLENQVDRNTYEGMLQDRRLTERYSPSELLDNGAWNNFFDPQRYMQFDNKDTLNPDNGQKLASLSQDELTQLKTARDNETDPTLKAKLWELYLKAIESKSQSGGYLKKKGSYQVGGISDNDKNSNEITQNNSNLNWIQRGLFPEKYPYLTEGSDKKTHRLATAGFDDGTMVFPTIVQNKDRSLVEFDIDKALDYAMKTNTGVMVKDPQLADYYSKNGLIKHYQTGVKVTNYVKPIVPLQKYLTIDTIVPQQVNPIVSTPLVQKVKQILLPSNIVTPIESGYSSHSKASDKVYEQQTGALTPSNKYAVSANNTSNANIPSHQVNNNPNYFRHSESKLNDVDSLFEDVMEVADPTGILSWDDVYRAWYNDDETKVMDALGALPYLGKLTTLTNLKKIKRSLDGFDRAINTGDAIIDATQTNFPKKNLFIPSNKRWSEPTKVTKPTPSLGIGESLQFQTGGFNHNTFNKILYGDMQSGGVNSLFPSTTILNQQDIVRKELQDYFKSLGKVNATKRLNDMKNEYVSSNNNMNTKYQIPLIQEAYLMAYPVEMVPKSKSKRY